MIAIVLYVLDMWSVLFVSYAGCWDLIKRKDCMHWTCGQCCLYMDYVGGMFKYSDWTEHTGYVVSVVVSPYVAVGDI